MGDGSGGANTADSYIGSLISLTSKSEIRYEGILYVVDTENSNIALQNVRSFGTEGRKKDGPPIYPSDKVYEYIVFRGSDIKDLQVKSSPSVQPPPQQPPTDPAIVSLQSQSSQPASIPSAFQPPPPGPQDAPPPQLNYPGLPPAAFRPGVPQMYQPTAAWAPPAGPNGNLAMPMYWHGYYRPPPGGQLLPQQMPPQPPPSLPQPPLPQAQGMQQISSRPSPPLNLNNSISLSSQLQAFGSSATASTSIPGVIGSVSSVPSAPESNSLQTPVVSSLTSLAGNVPPAPIVPPGSVAPAAPIVPPPSIAPPAAIVPPTAIAPPAAIAPTVSAPVSAPVAVQGVSAVITPASKNPRRVVGTVQPTPPQPQSSGASLGSSSVPLATPSLPSASSTLAQRSQAAPQAFSGGMVAPGKDSAPNPPKQEQKAAEFLNSQSTVSLPAQTRQQESQPLLPLPAAPIPQRQGNGTVAQTYVRRGRGRGTGTGRGVGLAHPTQQFTEDFDFTAMNEKFNKDAVWGVLGGKGDKIADAEDQEIPEGNVEDDIPDGPAQKGSSDVPKMPTYVKDDFFDSLSCDALDREGRAERTKFSEQRKLDTETFGAFPLRSRGGRRGGGRRGGYRGGYYNSNGGFAGGRGNSYGRGRGSSRPATAIN